jgi:hypothetical protein
MASKKAGRLAGLAALAGLAYMNKDKLFGAKDKTPDAVKSENKSESKSKSVDRDTDTGMEVMPSYATKKPVEDLGAIYDEAGTLSRFRRNTEGGELYDPGVSDGGRSAARLQSAADRRDRINANVNDPGYSAGMKKGGKVKKMASGGMTASASKRADGIATKGKTRGRMC